MNSPMPIPPEFWTRFDPIMMEWEHHEFSVPGKDYNQIILIPQAEFTYFPHGTRQDLYNPTQEVHPRKFKYYLS